MFIGSFDFGQMLNQSGLPQNQVFGQPVQGGDALGSFMGITPTEQNNAIDFDALEAQAGQGMGGNLMQTVGNQLTAEFLQNLFKAQEMPQAQPMSPVLSGMSPQLSNPYGGLLSPQPVSPMQSSGLLGAQPMQPMNPMLGGSYGRTT
tara:strand:+ start:13 stop:453 length:441 start_codon:yes stop_codon:yes gene_type:complete